MTATDALRYLDYEARLCRDRDSHEALCLLLPALLKLFSLPAMTSFEALDFHVEFRRALREKDRHEARMDSNATFR